MKNITVYLIIQCLFITPLFGMHKAIDLACTGLRWFTACEYPLKQAKNLVQSSQIPRGPLATEEIYTQMSQDNQLEPTWTTVELDGKEHLALISNDVPFVECVPQTLAYWSGKTTYPYVFKVSPTWFDNRSNNSGMSLESYKEALDSKKFSQKEIGQLYDFENQSMTKMEREAILWHEKGHGERNVDIRSIVYNTLIPVSMMSFDYAITKALSSYITWPKNGATRSLLKIPTSIMACITYDMAARHLSYASMNKYEEYAADTYVPDELVPSFITALEKFDITDEKISLIKGKPALNLTHPSNQQRIERLKKD